MGDLLCAAPVILSELQKNKSVHLLLFPSSTLHDFCNLIDFSPYQDNLHLHSIPDSGRLTEWKRFLREMRCIAPEIIWISPHAPAADSSWKIPLILRTIQSLIWRNARLVGADTERLSLFFHRRLPVNRRLSLQQREWSAYRLFCDEALSELPPKISFIPEISARRKEAPLYDLVIHPGANAKNRKWPLNKYGTLVSNLPRSWKIALLGLPDDLAIVKKTMPLDRPVSYITGTILESIQTLASANTLFIMDSGNMHFAQVLGIPSIAVFGYTNPADIIDLRGHVEAIYEKQFPCQPCRKAICSQPEIYCLNSIDPALVAEKLKAQWNRLHGSAHHGEDLVKLFSN